MFGASHPAGMTGGQWSLTFITKPPCTWTRRKAYFHVRQTSAFHHPKTQNYHGPVFFFGSPNPDKWIWNLDGHSAQVEEFGHKRRASTTLELLGHRIVNNHDELFNDIRNVWPSAWTVFHIMTLKYAQQVKTTCPRKGSHGVAWCRMMSHVFISFAWLMILSEGVVAC